MWRGSENSLAVESGRIFGFDGCSFLFCYIRARICVFAGSGGLPADMALITVCHSACMFSVFTPSLHMCSSLTIMTKTKKVVMCGFHSWSDLKQLLDNVIRKVLFA